MSNKPKIITLCGSSRFVQEMSVVAWLLERDELAITMGLHLLPWWYSVEEIPDHLAEHEGCAKEMDALHMEKIRLSDEVFVVDANVDEKPYIGSSTAKEIKFAEGLGLPIRRFSMDSTIRNEVYSRMVDAFACGKPGQNQETI